MYSPTSYLPLLLGMRKKALHIADLDNPRVTYPLETNSDVFALHRDNVRRITIGLTVVLL